MSLPARILVVADIYDALAAKRPYRDAMPFEKVLSIMQSEGTDKLDAQCLDALIAVQRQSSGPGLMRLAQAVNRPVIDIPKETHV